jgi:hypothetical protein
MIITALACLAPSVTSSPYYRHAVLPNKQMLYTKFPRPENLNYYSFLTQIRCVVVVNTVPARKTQPATEAP